MANPTTNYSFAMPTNTDLVKDLPADFDIFGQAVDDRIKALNPETTAGDISYRASTANAKSRLAIGTAGQVLTVNSGATAPEWATISAGGLTLISEQVVTGVTAIDFTSIPSTYKQLFLIWNGIYHSNASGGYGVRLNSNSSAVYIDQGFQFQNSGGGNAGDTRSSLGDDTFGFNASSTTLHRTSSGNLLIDNYASTTKTKGYRNQYSYYDNTSGQYNTYIFNGFFNDTTAISSINIFRRSGTATLTNSTNTTVRLYGVS